MYVPLFECFNNIRLRIRLLTISAVNMHEVVCQPHLEILFHVNITVRICDAEELCNWQINLWSLINLFLDCLFPLSRFSLLQLPIKRSEFISSQLIFFNKSVPKEIKQISFNLLRFLSASVGILNFYNPSEKGVKGGKYFIFFWALIKERLEHTRCSPPLNTFHLSCPSHYCFPRVSSWSLRHIVSPLFKLNFHPHWKHKHCK